jgi:hypothetical protein
MVLTEAQKRHMVKLTFAEVYPHYLTKIKRKGRTVEELHLVIGWMTGFSEKQIKDFASSTYTFEVFFQKAKVNPNASLVTGTIGGYRIEEIVDPLSRLLRCLDKLVDELAKGKRMDTILRKP